MPDKTNLGIFQEVFPGIQKVLDAATGVLSIFSVDIGLIQTCINGIFCSQNEDITTYRIFLNLPEKKHVFILALGLVFLAIALA